MIFLAFEGLDGSGKSSLIKSFESVLNQKGIQFHQTREPGGTALGDEIRKLILRKDGEIPNVRTELLLYEASRAQHVETVIKPKLAQGIWVLSDRFSASSIAFQSAGRTIPLESVVWLNKFATSDLEPDLNILLDLTAQESKVRRQNRSIQTGEKADRIESEQEDFHERVRLGFLLQAQANPEKWLVLDARLSTDEMLLFLLKKIAEKQWLV